MTEVSKILSSRNLSDFCKDKPYKYEEVNYILYSNKEGKYSWRPLQIINPALYVSFVHLITEEENWRDIKERFKEFQADHNIICMSIPIVSTTKRSDKAEQISFWYNNVEQESLRLVMEFDYVVHTDIANCYESIYTHSIPWALHGKEEAKKEKNNKNLLGNKIDKLMQDMNYGQTNGIPQGSVLSDFIAEIVLGSIDSKLSEKIRKEIGSINYKIIRYRDDYRIFTNDKVPGERILKLLYEVLQEFNLKLNDKKTHLENEIILSAIKEDKIKYAEINKSFSTIQQELLIIYKFSKDYPNSGSLVKWLIKLHKKIIKNPKMLIRKKENVEVLISILTEIMFRNPRVIPQSVGIISILLKELNIEKKIKVIDNIQNKLSSIPNIGFLEIWLQRLRYPIKQDNKFDNKLCKNVSGNHDSIWNIDWISQKELKDKITKTDFVNREELEKLSEIMQVSEISLFDIY